MKNVARLLLLHPLNRRSGRVAAIGRFARWQVSQWLLPGDLALPFVNDTMLVLRKGMSGATGNWYCGLHEHNEMGFALHMLRAGDMFGDIGANVGSYTILATAVGATVVSVEASPQTYRALMRNVKFNNVEDRVEARCVSASSGSDVLRFSEGLGAMNHVMAAGEEGPSIAVPAMSLDEIFHGRRPRLIKIDVEGHERDVLEGAPATLGNPELLAVIMETNALASKFGGSEDELFAIMAGHGFAPHRYDAIARRLTPGRTQQNTIFVRDADMLNMLCAAAPRYRISNGDI